MKKYLLMTTLAVTVVVLVSVANKPTGTIDAQSFNAAFQDGAYLGQLAAKHGENPHLAVRRWGTIADQQSFVTGYISGYGQVVARDSQKMSSLAEAAFVDGLYLGKLDAKDGREPHVASGRWTAATDKAFFTQGYNQSYKDTTAARVGPIRAGSEALLIRK